MKLARVASMPGVLRAQLRDPDFELGRLHCDSRRADAQTAFLALAGLRTDGHRYVEAARQAGAPALFVSEPGVYERLVAEPPDGLAGVFLVPPGRAVLADLSAALTGYPHREVRLLGVTGTSGKTTVVHLVTQLLGALGQPCARVGTQGLAVGAERSPSERTTPEAPDIHALLRRSVEQGVRTAAMEVTSIGIELERSHGLSFAAAAFTNLSQDHLDFHHDMEAYRDAKFRLFLEYDTAAAVVNVDDAAGRLLAERLGVAGRARRLLDYGLERPATLTLEALRTEADATVGRVRYRDEVAPFRFGLPGRFNLANLLAALGLLLSSGESLQALAPAIAACAGPAGRFERVGLEAPFTVLVDYAHKPDALERVLRAARPLAHGRLRVLFGCGGERDRTKRPQMGAIAQRLADQVVLTSDNPRGERPEAILDEIEAGMSGPGLARRIVDRREAIHWLLHQARAGDVVLIAGKGDETYQEVAGRKMPFDDRDVVCEWSGEL